MAKEATPSLSQGPAVGHRPSWSWSWIFSWRRTGAPRQLALGTQQRAWRSSERRQLVLLSGDVYSTCSCYLSPVCLACFSCLYAWVRVGQCASPPSPAGRGWPCLLPWLSMDASLSYQPGVSTDPCPHTGLTVGLAHQTPEGDITSTHSFSAPGMPWSCRPRGVRARVDCVLTCISGSDMM